MQKIVLPLIVLLFSGTASVSIGAEEFYQDFQNGSFDQLKLKIEGKNADFHVKPQQDGLRITQETPGKYLSPVGCATKFKLKGDFEVTATFEFISVEEPTQGYGNGVTLRIVKDEPNTNAATLARFYHPTEGHAFVADAETPAGEKRDHKHEYVSTSATKGRLRLKRTGDTVQFLASEDGDQEFREIAKMDNFGSEDVGYVRIAGVSGMSPSTLDVRFLDLKVIADELPLKAQTLWNPPLPQKRSLWKWWLLLLGIGICVVIGYLVYRRMYEG